MKKQLVLILFISLSFSVYSINFKKDSLRFNKQNLSISLGGNVSAKFGNQYIYPSRNCVSSVNVVCNRFAGFVYRPALGYRASLLYDFNLTSKFSIVTGLDFCYSSKTLKLRDRDTLLFYTNNRNVLILNKINVYSLMFPLFFKIYFKTFNFSFGYNIQILNATFDYSKYENSIEFRRDAYWEKMPLNIFFMPSLKFGKDLNFGRKQININLQAERFIKHSFMNFSGHNIFTTSLNIQYYLFKNITKIF